MSNAFPPPRDWLAPITAQLDAELRGAAVEGIAGGPGWLSLRIGGRFLWLMATNGLRAVWLDTAPTPRTWLDLLGRHRSPFSAHLRQQVVTGAAVLESADAHADGLSVTLGDRVLSVRFWPRPGGLWLTGSGGEELAQNGRMGGVLKTSAAATEATFDTATHTTAAREHLVTLLLTSAQSQLRQNLSRRAKKDAKLLRTLESERERAQADQGIRAVADVMASQLHRVRPGQRTVELVDFEGSPMTVELDPRRPPAQNLDRLYKRAAKAERTFAALGPRIEHQQKQMESVEQAQGRLDEVEGDLVALLQLALELNISLRPAETSKPSRSVGVERLPYRRYRLTSGVEVRVGRSARDNDVLTQRYAHGKDLWLHAQGVEGSHVVLRTGGRQVSSHDIEAAAQLAAQFSRARHSETVPVIVTEKRFVRKPRGSAPGSVSAERAKTLFVSPKVPEDCEVVRSE